MSSHTAQLKFTGRAQPSAGGKLGARSASLLVFSLLTIQVGLAQSQPSTQFQDFEKRVQNLEQKLDQIEKRVNAALPPDASPQAPGAASDRINALDMKLQLLEKNNQAAQNTPARNAPVVTAGPEGFSISSADKSFRLKVGGYGQADAKTFYNDRSHLLTNAFSLRRARLNFDASLGKFIDLRLSPEFGNGSVLLYDAYADLKFQPYAVVRGGKFKTPLGLEMLQSDTELTFIERGLPSDLVPNRDEGFQVYGNLAGRFAYQVGVVNGAPDGTNTDGDTNDGKDIVARVFATPFAGSGPKMLQGLGFGIGTSSGRQNGTTLPALKSMGGQATFFSYNATAIAAGRRLRYTPQMYYYNGPFGLVAEYVQSSQTIAATISNTTVSREISNHAWQVAGSWVLTGEKKSYKGVVPKRTMEGGSSRSSFGAWELAARYSELNVDPNAFSAKLADITKSAEAARTWSVGLNWYLSKNARLSFDYDQTHFQHGAITGNRPTEKAFEQRFQVVF